MNKECVYPDFTGGMTYSRHNYGRDRDCIICGHTKDTPMTKKEIKQVVDELRNNISYPDVEISPLTGCGLKEFPERKIIRKEVIVQHLRWQCIYLNGGIDEEELTNNLEIFKWKKIIMI